jgi:RHS repeat-associated protein
VTFSDANNDGVVDATDIKQINHYYPFGLNMEGNWNGSFAEAKNKYQYNGKELNSDFGLEWIDYGARWYAPDAPRWVTIDPLAEMYAPYSPYQYVMNNPVNLIDPTGMGHQEMKETFDAEKDFNINRLYGSFGGNGIGKSESNSFKGTGDTPDNGYIKNTDGSYTQVNDEGGEGYDVIYNGCSSCTIFKDVIMYNNTLGGTRLAPGLWVRPAQGGLTPVDDPFTFGLAGGLRSLSSFLFRSSGSVAKSGIANSKALGNVMEQALGMTGPKTAIQISGRIRVPDRLDLLRGVLEESKNVKHLNLTSQLRDYLQYSQNNGLRLILHTRANTTFSKPLQQLINNGIIIHNKVPGF